MRVCLVSREVAPYFGAGIGTYVSQMSRAWAAAGHEVHIVTDAHEGLVGGGGDTTGLGAAQPPEALRAAGRAGGTVRWHTIGRGPGQWEFLRYSTGVYAKVRELHERGAFDYVEFPEYWAEGWASIRGARALGRLAGAVLGVRLHTPTWLAREINGEAWLDEELAHLELCEGEAVRGADVLVSPTRSLLGIVRARLRLGEGGPPAAVIPYPFDAADAAEMGDEAAEEADEPTVLYFGRLEQRKGVTHLVDAAARLLEGGVTARFRFIGGDTATGPGGSSMLAHLRERAPDRWRDRFRFEPARPRAELGAAIRGATVCCFPSVWENFPNALLEAMSLGAVVVGANVGGIAEIIRDGEDGLLAPPDGLDEAIARALGDAALRQRLSAGAPRRIAELCDPARIAAEHAALVESARAGRGAGGVSDPGPEVVVLGDGGAEVDPAFAPAAAEIMRADPALAAVAAGVEHDDGSTWFPAGLDPELLALGPRAWRGAVAIRKDLAPGAGAGDWALMTSLAVGGHCAAVIPEVLVRGVSRPREPSAAEAASVLALHRRCGRVLRMVSAERGRERDRLRRERDALAARVAELSSPAHAERVGREWAQGWERYRLADRANELLKSLRLQGAVRRLLGGGAPRR